MTNEYVDTTKDASFELPDVVDSLLGEDLEEGSQENIIEPDEPKGISAIDPYSNKEEETVVGEPAQENYTAIQQYLINHGVSDPHKLQYEDEDGNATEVDFDSLSSDEQLNIIEELSRPNITEEEINTINYLRRNNMNLQEVVEYFADQKVKQYIESNQVTTAQSYKIDDYSNEELYLADLKTRNANFTDEELIAKLEMAKSNEELFNKEVDQLRSYYKAQEEAQIESQRQQEEFAQQQYTNALYQAMDDFNEIALDYTDEHSDTLEIEVEDKKKSMSYLLDIDAEGKSQLVRDMENPDALIELAWLRTCGADAFSSQSKYYKDIISERNRKIASLEKQIEKLKTSNSVVVPTESKRTSKNSSSPWDSSGLL